MTVSKSILTASTVAFALIFGGGVYVISHLNTLAKPVTQRMASQALGVPVTIESMEISIQEKRVNVSGIQIGNPSGFVKPHIMTIQHVDVGLKTFGKSLVDFEVIDVGQTDVYVEVQNMTTNLQTLKKSIDERARIRAQVKTQAEEAEALKAIIRRFALNGSTLHPSVVLFAEQNLEPVNVSPIVLSGIGVKENGVLARDAIAQIMKPILDKFSKEAGSAGFYEGLSADALKEVGAGQVEQIKGQISEEADKIGSGIKGLFSGE